VPFSKSNVQALLIEFTAKISANSRANFHGFSKNILENREFAGSLRKGMIFAI
jgi:hypothetical protein